MFLMLALRDMTCNSLQLTCFMHKACGPQQGQNMTELLRNTGKILEQQVIPNATAADPENSTYGFKQLFGETEGAYVAELFANASARSPIPPTSNVKFQPTFVCLTQKYMEDEPNWNWTPQRVYLPHGDHRYLDGKCVSYDVFANNTRT